jgi:hypothetical protein
VNLTAFGSNPVDRAIALVGPRCAGTATTHPFGMILESGSGTDALPG